MKLILFLISFPVFSFTQWTETEMTDLLAQGKINPPEAIEKLAERGTSAYNFGLILLRANRQNDALDWYEALTIFYDSAEFLFGKAWVHFQIGEPEAALEAGEFVLERSEDLKTKARCHYMLGQIWLEDLNPQKASDHFGNSLRLYAELGLRGGQYLANAGLAASAIQTRQYALAQDFIGKALAFNIQLKKPYTLGYVNDLLAEIHFQEGDYPLALDHSLRAHAEYEKDADLRNQQLALVRIGFFQILSGDINAGYDTAKKVDTLAAESENPKLAMLNNLTWMVLYRCSNNDYTAMRQEFETWAKAVKQKDYYANLLIFSDTVSCPKYNYFKNLGNH